MSNDWLNIRFFAWHLQSERDTWWVWTLTRNDFHPDSGYEDGYFAVYKFPLWR